MSDPPSGSSSDPLDVLGDASCWCGGRGICSACPPCKEPVPPAPTLTEFAAYVQASVVEGGSILPPPCETCDGSGTISEGYRDEYGSVVEQSSSTCPKCNGSGDA
jgi:hypothetical protein